MKINYLQEAYFPKLVGPNKAVIKQKTDDELVAAAIDHQEKAVAGPLLDELNNREFLYKIGNFFKDYIHCNANTTPPSVLEILGGKYDSTTKTLSVDFASYYTRNATSGGGATARTISIQDNLFRNQSLQEINDAFDNFITTKFLSFFKKLGKKQLLSRVSKIHVNRIYLYKYAPESVGGYFPKEIKVNFDGEYYNCRVLTNQDVKDIFDKVSKLFEFCMTNVTLKKRENVVENIGLVPSDLITKYADECKKCMEDSWCTKENKIACANTLKYLKKKLNGAAVKINDLNIDLKELEKNNFNNIASCVKDVSNVETIIIGSTGTYNDIVKNINNLLLSNSNFELNPMLEFVFVYCPKRSNNIHDIINGKHNGSVFI